MGVYGVALQNEIVKEITTEYKNQPTFNADIVEIKVKNAIREIRASIYPYSEDYQEDLIEKDLYDNHFSRIKGLAVFDFAQIGAPFEKSHNENSINRTWVDRSSFFKDICPFVRVL